MSPTSGDITPGLLVASADFWKTYYASMLALHTRHGRTLKEPIRDRNLSTTETKHISVFEQFWRVQLSSALGVPVTEVGPRRVVFRSYRTKKFDACWPLVGKPRVLISVKSMQNAYRNLTNRIEEAIGDSAVLRLYNSNAVFGFFFFMLHGKVASGQGEQGISLRKTGPKGFAPFLEFIEEGGDFFDLSDVARYRKPDITKPAKARGRQDSIRIAEQSLLDLVSARPARRASVHYDAIAFAPTRIKRKGGEKDGGYEISMMQTDERLDHRFFLSRLISVARLRGFIK
jgi:hypothetical protein